MKMRYTALKGQLTLKLSAGRVTIGTLVTDNRRDQDFLRQFVDAGHVSCEAIPDPVQAQPEPAPAPPLPPAPKPEPEPEPEPEPVRAREEDGTFRPDDPSTPENEAFDPPTPAKEEPKPEAKKAPAKNAPRKRAPNKAPAKKTTSRKSRSSKKRS